MALFTKLFKRDFDPYSIPGARWHRITYLPSTGTIKGDLDGVEVITSSTYTAIAFPSDYMLIDHVTLPRGGYGGSTQTGYGFSDALGKLPDGRPIIRIVAAQLSNFPDGFDFLVLAAKLKKAEIEPS